MVSPDFYVEVLKSVAAALAVVFLFLAVWYILIGISVGRR
jgi:hypothetical protein